MVNCKVFVAILIVFCLVHENFAVDVLKSDLETRNYEKPEEPCKGLPGRDGRDGRDSIIPGPRGLPGPRGPPGNPGIGGTGGGSVYTRWGRKDCKSGTTLLYEGVMAGSHYTHKGGGSNYLCMPLNPIYGKTIAGNQGYTYLYGVEYEMNAHAPLFSKNLHDHEAPCAVCFAELRGSQVMIPARNVCPKDWTLEYKGYLMSDHIGHHRSQFICVDSDPTSTLGTHANLNGALLYVVESHCGSLPCLPYKQGAELTCAVCTK